MLIRIPLTLLLGATMVSCVLPPRKGLEHRENVVRYQAKPPLGGTQKWNPIWWLGNADDSTPPKWYRPNQQGRRVLWQARNPLHNFTFYVIGIADKDFLRYGHEPEAVFSKDGGWNWAVIQRGWLRLPFISYQGRRLQFYALWRERGNFGLKLNRVEAPTPTAAPNTVSSSQAARQAMMQTPAR